MSNTCLKAQQKIKQRMAAFWKPWLTFSGYPGFCPVDNGYPNLTPFLFFKDLCEKSVG